MATNPMVVGDDVHKEPTAPFHLNFTPGFQAWLARHDAGLAFSTYTAGKVVMVGRGRADSYAVSERTFDTAMAIATTDDGFMLSMRHQVWRFANSLVPGQLYEGWDRLYLPRQCHVTGAVDVHDLAIDRRERLLAVATGYNCVASLDMRGSFNPIWRPPFIDAIVGEDRCHLNGFCLENGIPAYVTIIGASNVAGGWREHRADGGLVMDMRTGKSVAEGLAMPHSPRLYRGKLWVLEAGTGWFGFVDRQSSAFNKVAWCPGFVRGLRFVGNYAIIGISKPRNKVFEGLPLDEELRKRGVEPVCGVYIVNIDTGEIEQRIDITGSVEELYDVIVLPGALAPLLIGLQGDEAKKFVFLGPDTSVRK
ncbi:MAG: TIGR03032 family protein [Parvibaculum sp.]|uniref:TIGR03032 family protein n=1 Tax=Parvibaculum sp. TaxID=2024848 RepID=UPI003C743977